jgi:hypothetical protein
MVAGLGLDCCGAALRLRRSETFRGRLLLLKMIVPMMSSISWTMATMMRPKSSAAFIHE